VSDDETAVGMKAFGRDVFVHDLEIENP